MTTPLFLDYVFSFVAFELAAENLLVAQSLDRGVRLGFIGHVNKTEALRSVVETVRDYSGGVNLSVSFKFLTKDILGKIVA